MATNHRNDPARSSVRPRNTLDFIGVDFRLDLRFTDGSGVQLESACTVTDRSGGSVVVDLERKDSLLPILRLFGAELVRSSIDDGVRTLTFADGATLVADADADADADGDRG